MTGGDDNARCGCFTFRIQHWILIAKVPQTAVACSVYYMYCVVKNAIWQLVCIFSGKVGKADAESFALIRPIVKF